MAKPIICRHCEADLTPPDGRHFGGCQEHPINKAIATRGMSDSGDRIEIVEAERPEERNPAYSPTVRAPDSWLAGSELKVTEQFLKDAIKAHTGVPVESVKFIRKNFVVRFE